MDNIVKSCVSCRANVTCYSFHSLFLNTNRIQHHCRCGQRITTGSMGICAPGSSWKGRGTCSSWILSLHCSRRWIWSMTGRWIHTLRRVYIFIFLAQHFGGSLKTDGDAPSLMIIICKDKLMLSNLGNNPTSSHNMHILNKYLEEYMSEFWHHVWFHIGARVNFQLDW